MNYEILRREMICSRLPTAMCHASTVLPLPDGTVLSAWFGGSYEGEGDTSIWTARRADGVWSVPVPIAHVEEPHWNPVPRRGHPPILQGGGGDRPMAHHGVRLSGRGTDLGHPPGAGPR